MTLQLFLVAVLPFMVLVLGVAFGSLALHHKAMRSLVADRNLRAVQSAAVGLSKEINHFGETLELIALDISPDQPAGELFTRLAPELKSFDGGVALLKPTGEIAAASGGVIQEYLGSPEWQSLRRDGSPESALSARYLSVVKISNSYYEPVVVQTPGGMVLLGLFSPNKILSAELETTGYQHLFNTLVIGPNYQVLYSSGSVSPDESYYTHPGISGALAGRSEINYLDTSTGEHVITTSSVAPVGWALMTEESWEDIASPLLKVTQNAPLIVIPVFALSLLAIWFGLSKIVQPIQKLELKANDLARGNFESISAPVGGVPEIGHLQQTLVEMAGKLREAQNSLHSYIGAITDSVESERRNLARDLHDGTLQSLIALGQYTQYAMHWNKDPRVEKSLEEVVNLTDQGVKDLRRLVQGLRPIYIEDLGLATALEMQAGQKDLMSETQVHFRLEGDVRRLKPEIEMALFRIAQEALSNVRRHSEAKNAWIVLHFMPAEVALEIHDDGKGFTPPSNPVQLARAGHYGLLGLHERSELIGARLILRSSPGEGAHVIVRLPDNEG